MGFRRNHSRVDELPRDLREQVDRMILEGDTTYDEMAAFVKENGFDVSRSSLGRYGQKYFNAYKRLRIVEDKAKALVSQVGDGMALEEAASKMMVQQVLDALMDETLDVKALPRIISDFAKLQASTVLRERLKGEIAEKVKTTASAVEKIAKKGGLSDEAANEIRAKILGIGT